MQYQHPELARDRARSARSGDSSSIGLWIEHPVPLARVLRAAAASMTLLGIVMTLMAVPKSFAQNRVIVGTVELSSLVVALGWVLLIEMGTFSVLLAGARIFRQEKREKAIR
jgi:hypothetical protein